MDIVRKKAKKTLLSKKYLLIATSCLLLIWLMFYSTSASRKIAASNVLLDTVRQGELNIDVRGIGVLVPKEVHWVAAEVSGRVDKVHIKAGAAVKKGDIIVSLSNPVLMQQLEESQWEQEEMQAQLNAEQVNLESRLLDQETLVNNSRLDYERAQLTFKAQQTLLAQGIVAISKVEHQKVKIEVQQLLQRWQMEEKRLAKSRENLIAQKQAFQARLKRMTRSVARMQHQVDSLIVKATIDSIVQEMPLEPGQQISAATKIARLARNDDFIAEIRIPEKQIYQVALTQQVTLDTKTTQVSGQVIRIDPLVVNGSVQVDIAITGALPKEARPELTVEGIIHVASLRQSLFMKRPMFAKANASGTVFVVASDTKQVSQRQVKYGQASQSHIEIKNGLSAGDNVVISDVSSWKEKQIQAIQ